jgi:hypothetical protein
MTTPWIDKTEVEGINVLMDNRMKYHGRPLKEPGYANSWPVRA